MGDELSANDFEPGDLFVETLLDGGVVVVPGGGALDYVFCLGCPAASASSSLGGFGVFDVAAFG